MATDAKTIATRISTPSSRSKPITEQAASLDDASLAKAVGRIELSLATPAELFNALDPSPLVGRDIDDEVEAYIIESAGELPHRKYALTVHFAARPPTADEAAALTRAIRAYFLYRRDVQARRLRLLMRQGRQALAVGLIFLVVCVTLGFVALKLVASPLGALLNEGFLIIGWVANWRPIEIFLYDWQPMRQQREILDSLARMEISFPTVPAKG
jgi:hypothetical protein